ncbi:hypothetical protein BDW59DRAFT_157388 [Aspergillus cavernicola]|uniref:Uncharacterized protein n=1 Tax=Aspergillus cavernicola TaxID=176166 RepID=A0ABR4IXW9_9EURO
MARGVLGKSRPAPQMQGISKPVLNYTNALPRDDLREISHGVSYSRPMHQVTRVEQRRGLPGGRNPQRKPEAPAPGFDFRITEPPAEVMLASATDHRVDESMIGIALGSPRLLETHNLATKKQQVPPPTLWNTERPLSLQRKSSKWRKIGGLFKAKSAMASNANKPFYQVRTEKEGPLQGSTHSIDYESQQRAGTRAEPIENTEVWPCLVPEQEAIMRQQGPYKREMPGSLLQVEIPTVEMERYSVMFGGLLDNSRPSLLNRRSKTLDNVAIPSREASSPLGAPRRRATSPARPRSPNFTLFPMPPTISKASKILGTQNLPQAPDSLRKAQPPLGEPYHGSASDEDSSNTLTAPIPPKQASHRSQASMTSFLSSTSIGTDDETLLIHKIEPVRTFAGMEPPRWDSLNRKAPALAENLEHTPTKNLTISTRELRTGSASTGSTTSSSLILSPLNSTRTGASVSPVGNKVKPAFPPPPRTYAPGEDPIPTIEVSVARSVSVSKGKKQMLVPVRTRASQFNPNERLVPRQAKTPHVTGGEYGHRPGFSQDVHIEMA